MMASRPVYLVDFRCVKYGCPGRRDGGVDRSLSPPADRSVYKPPEELKVNYLESQKASRLWKVRGGACERSGRPRGQGGPRSAAWWPLTAAK
jgi:hypothetical protein